MLQIPLIDDEVKQPIFRIKNGKYLAEMGLLLKFSKVVGN